MLRCLIMAVLGFLSGAVLYSYIIPKVFYKVDIRKVSEDGNPGSSNVIRACGLPVGMLCMLLDVAKAFVPVFVSSEFLGLKGPLLVPVTVAPVIGHAFSPMLRFHGGKAVSTAYGSLLGLIAVTRFVIAMAVIMAFFRFVVSVRPDSAGVVTDMTVCSVLAACLIPQLWLKAVILLISAVVIVKQIQNPDKGARCVCIWHYSVTLSQKKLKFSRI